MGTAGGIDYGVFCLDAADGDTLWWYTYPSGQAVGVESSALIEGNDVFIGSDAVTGEHECNDLPYSGALFQFPLNGSGWEDPDMWYRECCAIWGTPVKVGPRIYITTGKGLRCTMQGGSSCWDGETGGELNGSAVITTQSDTLIYHMWGDLWCHTQDGDVAWQADASSNYSSPALSNGKIVITEDAGLVSCIGDAESSIARREGHRPNVADDNGNAEPLCLPNPCGRTVAIQTAGLVNSGGAVRIFDGLGRSVRKLAVGPGVYRTEWDGRDAAGREVPAGVYLVVVTNGLSKRTERLRLLR